MQLTTQKSMPAIQTRHKLFALLCLHEIGMLDMSLVFISASIYGLFQGRDVAQCTLEC